LFIDRDKLDTFVLRSGTPEQERLPSASPSPAQSEALLKLPDSDGDISLIEYILLIVIICAAALAGMTFLGASPG